MFGVGCGALTMLLRFFSSYPEGVGWAILTMNCCVWLMDRAGLPLYATALREDTEDIRDLDLTRAAVVIGSEVKGVSQAVLDQSAKTVKIPMTDRCESLNAAAAGTVVLWQMCQGTNF